MRLLSILAFKSIFGGQKLISWEIVYNFWLGVEKSRVENLGVEKSVVESLGFKSSGLKLGVEKSGVEKSGLKRPGLKCPSTFAFFGIDAA